MQYPQVIQCMALLIKTPWFKSLCIW
jgi:hypothetical protein